MSNEWNRTTKYFAIGLILIILVFIGWQIREIFKPIITAGLIAYIFYPFVQLLCRRFRISQALASRIVYFISLSLMITVPVLLAPTLVIELKVVATDLLKTLEEAQVVLSQPIQLAGIQLRLEALIPSMKSSLTGLLAPLPADALQLLETTSRGTLWFLVIIVSVYYFMTDWDKLRDWAIRLAPADSQHDLWKLYFEIKKVWMGYLRGQLTLMIIVAIVFTIIWSAIGLPGALLLGLLAGLFSIIPDVGPFAATALALIVALLEGSNWIPVSHLTFALIVAGLYVVLINIKNIWLRPLILGRSVHMHEGIVFVAIIAAVIFTGIIGAFIVVPTLASLSVIGRYIHGRILGIPTFADEEPASSADIQPAAAKPISSRSKRKPVKPESLS